MRSPALLLLLLLAGAFSVPVEVYLPEHCNNFSGRLFRACIRTARNDATGVYSGRVIVFTSSDGTKHNIQHTDSSSVPTSTSAGVTVDAFDIATSVA